MGANLDPAASVSNRVECIFQQIVDDLHDLFVVSEDFEWIRLTHDLDLDVGWKANGGSGTYDTIDADGLGNLGVLTGDASAPNQATAVGLIYGLYGPIFGAGDGNVPA